MNLKPRPLPRREFLEGAAAFAVLSGIAAKPKAHASPEQTSEGQGGPGEQSVGKDIVMVHGASEGGWCFDQFRAVFEARGWTVRTPDLIGHGRDAADAKTKLVGIGLADYRDELVPLLKSLSSPPVLLGHSMGAVLVQQLAAMGLARAIVLVSPGAAGGHIAYDRQREGAGARLHDHSVLLEDRHQSGFRSRLHLFAQQSAEARAACACSTSLDLNRGLPITSCSSG